MNAKHRNAIEQLLSYPDAAVAEMLGMKLSLLRSWMRMPEFRAELKVREREQTECAVRLARQAVLNAVTMLARKTADEKTDSKILLDVLKASGALEDKGEDAGEALAEVIRRATAPDKGRDD